MAILKDLIVNGAARFIGDAYFNTIKAGTWNGNAISVTYGGTGLTSVASNKVLVGLGSATLTTRDIVTSVTSGSTGLVTSGAVYTAIANGFASNDAMLFAGTYLGSATSSSTVSGTFTTTTGITVGRGCTWRVSGGVYFANEKVEVGDLIIAINDNPGTAKSNYVVILRNIDPTLYVTINDALTIIGEKTFHSDVLIESGHKLVMTNFNVDYTNDISEDVNDGMSDMSSYAAVSHAVNNTDYTITLVSGSSASYGTQLVLLDDGYVSIPKLKLGGRTSIGNGARAIMFKDGGFVPLVELFAYKDEIQKYTNTSITTVTGWLPGDVDGNGVCDSTDLSTIQLLWSSAGYDSNADIDNDGRISITDFSVLNDMVNNNFYSQGCYPIKLDTNPYNSINSAYNNSQIPILKVNLTNYTGSLVVTLQKDGDAYIGITKHVTEGYLALFYISSSASYGKYIPLPTNELVTSWTNKQDKLTFDTTPTANSTKPVTSGGIKTYVDNAAPIGVLSIAKNPKKGVPLGKTWEDFEVFEGTKPYLLSLNGLMYTYSHYDDDEDLAYFIGNKYFDPSEGEDGTFYYDILTVTTLNASTGTVKIANVDVIHLPGILEPFTEAEIDEILGEVEENVSYNSY